LLAVLVAQYLSVGRGLASHKPDAGSVGLPHSLHVMRGHIRPKDGVASLAYDPRIHEMVRQK
jgi:hypothetical protein